MVNTIDYYNKNVQSFIDGTVSVDFTRIQNIFLELLPKDARVLDFGCGSGRDTKFFLDCGYQVDAIDGSMELCRAASEYTGIHVKQMLFQELTEVEKYEGIWACASILHVKKAELPDIIRKMSLATKENGIISIFTSAEDNEIIFCLNYGGLYGINHINYFMQENNKRKYGGGIQSGCSHSV